LKIYSLIIAHLLGNTASKNYYSLNCSAYCFAAVRCENLKSRIKLVIISDQHRLSHSSAIPARAWAGHSAAAVYRLKADRKWKIKKVRKNNTPL
jgi:hypothetical protein